MLQHQRGAWCGPEPVQDPDTGMGDITPSSREGGARAPLPSTFSHNQEGQWLWLLHSPHIQCTRHLAVLSHHTPSTCLGAIQGQLQACDLCRYTEPSTGKGSMLDLMLSCCILGNFNFE